MEKKDYIEIWDKILTKFKISSFVYDIGDNLRKFHLYKFLKIVFKNCPNNDIPLTIYDFGAGNWLYLDKIYKAIGENCLQRNVQLSGFDFSRAALEWGSCKYKNLKPKNVETILIPGDFVKALNSIEPDSTDMIFSLEVTEHLEDDEKFLSLTSKVLKEDGFLILSVPNSEPSFLSFDWFRYVFNHKKLIEKDIRVGHYRRYTTNKLHMMLNKVGFTTLKTEYYDFFWGDLIEFFLTQCFKRDSIFKKIFFYFCLPIIWLEDYVLNFLKVKRSGGIFILAQKTKSLDI